MDAPEWLNMHALSSRGTSTSTRRHNNNPTELDVKAANQPLWTPIHLNQQTKKGVTVLAEVIDSWLPRGNWAPTLQWESRRVCQVYRQFLKASVNINITMKVKVLAAQLCLTLCNPMECGPAGFSVHGILQARILKCVAISFSRESSSLPAAVYHLSHWGS